MSALCKLFESLRVRLRYDDYTIAEHFRAQGAHIGAGTRLLIRSLGSEPYLVSIGDETLVSSDVAFFTHDGAAWVLRAQSPTANHFGRIRIGRRCFIGARTILLPGAEIGDGSVIGAGSVVTGRLPGASVCAGVPAKVITSVDEWSQRILTESLPLSEELFPLERCDREKLRTQLEHLMPAEGNVNGAEPHAAE